MLPVARATRKVYTGFSIMIVGYLVTVASDAVMFYATVCKDENLIVWAMTVVLIATGVVFFTMVYTERSCRIQAKTWKQRQSVVFGKDSVVLRKIRVRRVLRWLTFLEWVLPVAWILCLILHLTLCGTIWFLLNNIDITAAVFLFGIPSLCLVTLDIFYVVPSLIKSLEIITRFSENPVLLVAYRAATSQVDIVQETNNHR